MDRVRVVLEDGRIIISPLASEERASERMQRLAQKMEQGDPILTGSVAHGGGILSYAIHQGLAAAGNFSAICPSIRRSSQLVDIRFLTSQMRADSTTWSTRHVFVRAYEASALVAA
jgi:DNA (cytosine-5)-methyltransferase 1